MRYLIPFLTAIIFFVVIRHPKADRVKDKAGNAMMQNAGDFTSQSNKNEIH